MINKSVNTSAQEAPAAVCTPLRLQLIAIKYSSFEQVFFLG
jgi:hypothetical protein